MYLCRKERTKLILKMKKLIFSILTGLLFTMPTCAQNYQKISSSKAPFKVYNNTNNYSDDLEDSYSGIRGGLSAGFVNTKGLGTDGANTGFDIGYIVGERFYDEIPLYIEGGIYLIQKGGKNTMDGDNITYSLYYSELPITVKYRIALTDDLILEPLLGGFISMRLAGMTKSNQEDTSESLFSSDVDSNFGHLDFGGRIGCGLSFRRFYVEASYDHGFFNIWDGDNAKMYTRALYVNVGLNF